MAAELVPPAIVSGHKGGIRALHMDECLIIDGVGVKTAHGTQIIAVLLQVAGFKNIFDTRLDTVGDLFESLLISAWFFRHGFLLSWDVCP